MLKNTVYDTIRNTALSDHFPQFLSVVAVRGVPFAILSPEPTPPGEWLKKTSSLYVEK